MVKIHKSMGEASSGSQLLLAVLDPSEKAKP